MVWDVICVGGGISGLSAALYTSQAGLKTAVFDTGKSQILSVGRIMNYPGFPEGISGADLLEEISKQVEKYGAEIIGREIDNIAKKENRFALSSANEEYEASYVVLASNLYTHLLETLGFSLQVNPYVPSGKIRSASGIGFDGATAIENLFLAGLHANIPSQAVVAAGQGAYIGVTIASQAVGKSYMWHD